MTAASAADLWSVAGRNTRQAARQRLPRLVPQSLDRGEVDPPRDPPGLHRCLPPDLGRLPLEIGRVPQVRVRASPRVGAHAFDTVMSEKPRSCRRHSNFMDQPVAKRGRFGAYMNR